MEDRTETVLLPGDAGPPHRPEGPEGPQPAALARGAVVGRYVILERIGAGGMGIVYAAYDPELDRKVALKLLRTDRLPRGPAGDAGRQRLLREAQALARLSHPNVVAVHDAGTFGDQVFLAMELVEGRTLRRWLAEAPRSWREVLDCFLPAGRGLAAAHAAGLVHRDFKPDNVLIGRDGRVRVVDFGLAHALGEVATQGTEELSQGLVLGTPSYMAPEVLRGFAADARSDQFSFCVALWEALHGERPFAGAGARGGLREAPAGNRVPGWLRGMVVRGLQADPAARHAAMDGFLRELESDPAARRRRWFVAAAALLLAGSAFGTLGYVQARRAQVCGGGEEAVAGVWNAERRQTVHAAFLATRLPFAENAWAGVEKGLDAYARSWAGMRREACEATRVRGAQSPELLDRRMLCLDQRLRQLDALTELLARADAQTVGRWSHSLEALDGVDDCGGSVALLDRTPLPREAGLRSQIQQVQSRLARARALQAAGKVRPALGLALAVDHEAAALPYRPLQGDAALLVGELRENDGDLPASERELYRALEAAEDGRDDLLKARCWRKLIVVVGARENHFEESHRLARLAEAALARAGGEPRWPRWEIAILTVEAGIFGMEGKFEDALRELDRVLALSRRHHLADSLYSAFNNLGNVYQATGDHQRALGCYRQALPLVEKAKGELHPDTAALELNLGTVLTDLRRFPEAETYFRRALATRERILEPDHPDIAESLVGLGVLWVRQGRPERALPFHARALQIYTVKSPGTMGWISAQNDLAEDLRGLGRYREAVEHLQEAKKALLAMEGGDADFLAALLDTEGNVYLDWGRPAEAVAPLAQAVAILEKKGALEDRADSQFALARALWEQGGDSRRAIALARQAREGFARSGDLRRENLAKADEWLARHAAPERAHLG